GGTHLAGTRPASGCRSDGPPGSGIAGSSAASWHGAAARPVSAPAAQDKARRRNRVQAAEESRKGAGEVLPVEPAPHRPAAPLSSLPVLATAVILGLMI